jgi:superfamily I DNA and/or RNA helicase
MEVKKKMEDYVIKNANIVVTTCNSAWSKRLQNLRFSHIIIDEAS